MILMPTHTTPNILNNLEVPTGPLQKLDKDFLHT
jgi:hypothetical protein